MASSAQGTISGRWRRPRALNVVRDPSPEELGARVDWSAWYLTDEQDMGQGNEQQQIIHVLESSLEQLAAKRGWQNVHIGVDNFFGWVEHEPEVRVSPDVYLLDNPPDPPLPKMWRTWLPMHAPPRVAIEIVSSDEKNPDRWRKDYQDGPEKYAQLGTSELVIFDPDVASGLARHPDRVPLQIYRRDEDGTFVRVHAAGGPAYSAELGVYLVIVAHGEAMRLRLACDAEGRDIVPTSAEAAEVANERAAAAERQLAELRE